MKRLAALLLLLTLLLTACGTPPAPQGSAASQSAASAPSSSVPPAAPPDSSQPEDAPQNEPYALPEGFVLLADAVPDILRRSATTPPITSWAAASTAMSSPAPS